MRPRFIISSFLCSLLIGATQGLRAELKPYTFSEPHNVILYIDPLSASVRSQQGQTSAGSPAEDADWITAWKNPDGEGSPVKLGSRLVLKLQDGAALSGAIADQPLKLARTVGPGLFILEAPSALEAAAIAQELAGHDDVVAAHPVAVRPLGLFDQYASAPNDPLFPSQWSLENRPTSRNDRGLDLNIRGAWARTQGKGVTIAVADDGIQLDHPDLAERVQGAPHFNFASPGASVSATNTWQRHGTPVAGLAAASANNSMGVSGVAPKASLASWIIFKSNSAAATDEQLMDMFEYATDTVAVQNHSWGFLDLQLSGPSLLERNAISNAITFGRNGLGTIMVRSVGNSRADEKNANDDAYPSDPRVIAVAAARADGRAASYSNQGACILIGAPSGDDAFPNLATTDRTGAAGFNTQANGTSGDYFFDERGFRGTSASAPLISGVVALMLSANPNLSYRDVQQILIHASRHADLDDPDLQRNGAGLMVSHNLGFGIPDAGEAVRLAGTWNSRPEMITITVEHDLKLAIPDDSLRLNVIGETVPEELQSIRALSSYGLHPDDQQPILQLGYADRALAVPVENFSGKAALIERGVATFEEKIANVAEAGAELAIVHNNVGSDTFVRMVGTAYSPIPAVSINENDGRALKTFLDEQPETSVQLTLAPVRVEFDITNSVSCEPIELRIKTNHPRRKDLRITLVSPSGTRSILQHVNLDNTAGPKDWSYFSTLHFHEQAQGIWTLEVSDQGQGLTGEILYAGLTVYGTPINDTDQDGLPDSWELQYGDSLDLNPAADNDHDTYSNILESIHGTNPFEDPRPLTLDIVAWDNEWLRLSWPSHSQSSYTLRRAVSLENSFAPHQEALPGFRVTEWLVPKNAAPSFFDLQLIR